MCHLSEVQIIVKFRINWTLCIGDGKIRAITPVGAVCNRTASARPDLSGKTASTKHGERKCLSVFRIRYKRSIQHRLSTD